MKGISPLIAVIMLIAFTMIVAGILAGWATQFVQTQRSELQFCSKAQILIQRAYFDSGSSNLNLAVYNTGSVPLSGFSVIMTYSNQTITTAKFENTTINYQEIGTIAVPIDNTLSEVVVQSLQCRGAQDLVGRYYIQGLGAPAY